MGLLTNNRLTRLFGYDSVTSNGKRKPASQILKGEDSVLKGAERKRMVGGTRDLFRNFALVQWMIRKHLDYVSLFDFQVRTTNERFNETLEFRMSEWSRPANCDVAGRHGFGKIVRMAEQRRTVDGDVFLLKLRDGRLQAIEGDRIRNPSDTDAGDWMNGVRVDSAGRALAYALHNRTPSGRFDYQRALNSSRVVHHGYFDRYDQVRGISPLAAALNSIRDVYEGIDYALAKLKVEQLFALVFYRDAEEALGDVTAADEDDKSGYAVDFGKGPVQLDLDPNDRAEFLKTDNPGSNSREFMNAVIGIALKALDIPFNFFDESHTNFFGSRAAWLLYDRSCIAKRADLLEMLRQITVWRLQLWIQSGELRLPRGYTLSTLPFEWVPRGMPWWDPLKEIKGELLAIQAGQANPYDLAKTHGSDFEENIRRTARAKEFAAEYGVTLGFSEAAAPSASPDEGDDE